MKISSSNKRKVINDPVYGFITIPNDIIFNIIEHPKFQRIRRIKQLGLTHLIYPGALHTRFHHCIGAMYLMRQAIDILISKGHEITPHEAESACIAILLHDIGHGPYSHTLENSIVSNVRHELISEIYMNHLNNEFSGELTTAISIFKNTYHKKFLSQLVASQLDMDRLDYLKRDSFFTGVAEGVINAERIIKMLDVFDDEVVVEAKGIYSIEKFIVSRRLMYWQVYLHKTVIAVEYLLRKILTRAKHLIINGTELFTTPPLLLFMKEEINKNDFINKPYILDQFSKLDDLDIFTAIKVWTEADDRVLSILSKKLVNRKLLKIEISDSDFSQDYIEDKKNKAAKLFNLTPDETSYFVYKDTTQNYALEPFSENIKIMYKDKTIKNITEASDNLNISVLSKPVVKYFLCYPKEILSM